MAYHNNIGYIGEDIATKWLALHSYTIVDRNFRRKWGEIDIICKKAKRIHFVEVKTVSYETKSRLQMAVSSRVWRPEEKVTAHKIKKLNNTIETWLAYEKCHLPWQIDVVTVRMVPREKYAQVKCIENVILEP